MTETGDNKQVDGIKRLDKKDLEKSRKLVLEEIDHEIETVKEQQEKHKRAKSLSVDSIIRPKKKEDLAPELLKKDKLETAAPKVVPEADKELKKRQEQKKQEAEAARQKVVADRLRREQEISSENKKREEAERKRLVQEELKRQEEEDKLAQEQREKQREKAEKQKNAREKAMREKAEKTALLEAKAREKEAQRVKSENEAKRQAEAEAKKKERAREKEKLKEKKKKQKENRWKKLLELKKHFRSRAKTYLKKAFNYLVLCVVILVFVYLLFALVVLKFNPDNDKVVNLSGVIKLPAVITSVGLIDFKHFKELEAETKAECAAEVCIDDLRSNIAKSLIIGHLTDKYSLEKNDPKLEQKINKMVFSDKEVNQVAINRIQKIDEMIKQGGNFVEIANKYADKQDRVDFDSSEKASAIFGDAILELAPGEISDIINREDGYYILRRYEKENVPFAYSYVYIKGKNLDAYLLEEMQNIRLWSLVELD